MWSYNCCISIMYIQIVEDRNSTQANEGRPAHPESETDVNNLRWYFIARPPLAADEKNGSSFTRSQFPPSH